MAGTPLPDRDRHEAWACVAGLNRAWRELRFDDAARFVAPDAVIVHPGFAGQSAGRDAFVQSYADFAQRATIGAYDERDVQVDVVDDTAIVSYGFRMRYEIDDDEHVDEGRDLLVLRRRAAGWRIVWRTVLLTDE